MRLEHFRQLFMAAIIATAAPVSAAALELPVRNNPAPPTTSGVPHVQLGVAPVPEISQELLRRVEAISGIEIHPTVVSLPGALGFWITEDVSLARPDVIVGGREFAHLHPDGSLHASLSPVLAAKAVTNGWAIAHPWANQRPGWEGFVMIYTPLSSDELEVVFQLIIEGFNFVTKSDPGATSGKKRPVSTQPVSQQQDPSLICSTC